MNFIIEIFNKLDHTLCMNSDKLQFGRDDCDCQSMDEMVESLESVEKNLKALEIIKEKIGWGFFYYVIAKAIYFTQEEIDLIKEVLR